MKKLLIILTPILLFFITRGAVTHDEGYILNSSMKILHGLLPYRDFHFVYTPLSLFITAFSFALYPSILSSRILLIFISLVSCILIYKTIFFSTKNNFYSVLAVILFVAWGPTHLNFVWPVNFAILFSLFVCYSLLKFREEKLKKYLFLAGFFAFAVFLSKQNFGAAILIPILVFFVAKSHRKISNILPYIYGYALGVALFLIYLFSTNSFSYFISDLYTFTFKWIITNGSLNTPFIYRDELIKMIGRTTFYLLPVFISLASIILLLKKRKLYLLFLPIFIICFYIIGIRPTTDYVHLTPLLSITGIPLAFLLKYSVKPKIKFFIFTLLFFLIILGFQTALFKGYYRWDDPLIYHNNFSKKERVMIFLSDKLYTEFNEIDKTVNTYTKSTDAIYVNSFTPVIYFIANRPEATQQNFLSSGIDQKLFYGEVLKNLETKKVKLIFLIHNSMDTLPIKNYLEKKYVFLKRIGDNDVYKRRQ